MSKRKGFTLIELIMVIVILGILSVVAIPKYYDLQTEAKTAAEKGVVGAVRAGIHTYFAQNRNFPTVLDNSSTGACSVANPCFDEILAQGGVTSDDWTKSSATTYTGPAGTTYTYTAASGEFE